MEQLPQVPRGGLPSANWPAVPAAAPYPYQRPPFPGEGEPAMPAAGPDLRLVGRVLLGQLPQGQWRYLGEHERF